MRRRGEIAEALSTAASRGPATLRELAARAQVGYGAARYTGSRMVARGELVRVVCGKPAVVALPDVDDAPQQPADSGQLETLTSRWIVLSAQG